MQGEAELLDYHLEKTRATSCFSRSCTWRRRERQVVFIEINEWEQHADSWISSRPRQFLTHIDYHPKSVLQSSRLFHLDAWNLQIFLMQSKQALWAIIAATVFMVGVF